MQLDSTKQVSGIPGAIQAINYSALCLLYGRNPAKFQVQIENEKDYFSTIATAGAPLVCLIHFLSRSSRIYGLLAEHAKTAIQHSADNDVTARCLAWFTAESLLDHAERLRAWILGKECPEIERETWDDLLEISDSPEWEKTIVRLASAYYVSSPSYDGADKRFNEAVRPLLPSFALDDCIELIRGIETNGQTWERRGAYRDHRELRARALEINPAADLTEYRVFNRHLG
jgi:hypothetical protein